MQADEQLTPHFKLSELTASQEAARAGVPNAADSIALANLTRLARHGEGVRTALNDAAILVSSGLRTWIVNGLVKHIITRDQLTVLATRPDLVRLCKADTSAHMDGRAMDFTAPSFGTPHEIVARLWHLDLPFDQLIFEGTWVHYGIAVDGYAPRRQVLTAHFAPGKPTTYTRGIP